MTDPHRYLPARVVTVGDELWHEGWLWEVAVAEFVNRRNIGIKMMLRLRSVVPPHHYATVALDPEESVAYLYKEYA